MIKKIFTYVFSKDFLFKFLGFLMCLFLIYAFITIINLTIIDLNKQKNANSKKVDIEILQIYKDCLVETDGMEICKDILYKSRI